MQAARPHRRSAVVLAAAALALLAAASLPSHAEAVPLERAFLSNPRAVDGAGAALESVRPGQEATLTADMRNGLPGPQGFAYIVQVQDPGGSTVMLSWLEGELAPGQSLTPLLSWTPEGPGRHDVTMFAWEGVDEPSPLSPEVWFEVDVAEPAAPRNATVSNLRAGGAAAAGSEVQLLADVAGPAGLGYAVRFEVRDAGGRTVLGTWDGGSVGAGGRDTASVRWTPAAAGAYTVTARAFEDGEGGAAISREASLDVEASAAGRARDGPPVFSNARAADASGAALRQMEVGEEARLSMDVRGGAGGPRDVRAEFHVSWPGGSSTVRASGTALAGLDATLSARFSPSAAGEHVVAARGFAGGEPVYVQQFSVQARAAAPPPKPVSPAPVEPKAPAPAKPAAPSGPVANTGTVSFDRSAYPLPIPPRAFGDAAGGFLGAKPVVVHVRVNEPDEDVSATGEDVMNFTETNDDGVPRVEVAISRGTERVTVPLPPGASAVKEIAPDAGIFELDIPLEYNWGPTAATVEGSDELDVSAVKTGDSNEAVETFIQQGDIITVTYNDETDASGNENTVTDSSTFDLRDAVLQTDKNAYIRNTDMILTLIEPDFDLDSDEAEVYPLNLIRWDSDAARLALGQSRDFDPEPAALRETGDSTGIFQTVIRVPVFLGTDGGGKERLELGEEITLRHLDWGPARADYVGHEDEDVNLTIYTSNFGATIELDKKVYTWTDKAFITITAPDHNFDTNLVDEIGGSQWDPARVATREHEINNYRLVETGTDTGIFSGEVILTGFAHDVDGDGLPDASPRTSRGGSGPVDAYLGAGNDDGLTVSFEYTEGETVVGSALIRWTVGEAEWLEASYPASSSGIVRVTDPDLNLDPEAIDSLAVLVWSDSDRDGVPATLTETNEATGVFEGQVRFAEAGGPPGGALRVSGGDTVTASYVDRTLPGPYHASDHEEIRAAALIAGAPVAPLERAPLSDPRATDSAGNRLDSVSAGQQVQLAADVQSGLDRDQGFWYIVEVRDSGGATVLHSSASGTVSAGQSLSPSVPWTPGEAGAYEVTASVASDAGGTDQLSLPARLELLVGSAAAPGGAGAPAGPGSAAPRDAGVSIPEGSGVPACAETDECYIPAGAAVGAGDEVTWTNGDTAVHTVTSGVIGQDGAGALFDSGLMPAGSSFTYLFEEAGEYPYFCAVHPWMAGTVAVSGP